MTTADGPADFPTLLARFREQAQQARMRAQPVNIKAALTCLTEQERLAIASKFESGLSYEEIAKVWVNLQPMRRG